MDKKMLITAVFVLAIFVFIGVANKIGLTKLLLG